MEQNTNVSVTLTSELRLEQALHIEDPASVSKLTVSGMLTEDDFKYIRKNMANTLKELDMSNADVEEDTIPRSAFSYCFALNSVIIPDSVRRIGNSTFEFCTGLRSVSIPNRVRFVGDSAFFGCIGLIAIVIENGFTSIGNCSFFHCPSLISVEMGNNVSTIGSYAFHGCTRLTSVRIPASVVDIGYAAFSGCSKLAAFEVASDNVFYASIDGVLFDKSKEFLKACPVGKQGVYSIPAGVKKICDNAFAGCAKLTSIVFPDSVVTIGSKAFYECAALSPSLTIPEGVKSIGSEAFYGCTALFGINIPASAAAIGTGAFDKCINLEEINVASDYSRSGMLLSKTGKTLIRCPEGKQGVYTVSRSVEAIDNKAFEGCAKLTSIILSDSVKILGENMLVGCTGLISVIHIPEGGRILHGMISFVENSKSIDTRRNG